MDLERLIPPRKLAAAARALQPQLSEALAAAATSIERELMRTRQWVAWDRVRLIGQAQQRLAELQDRRFSKLGGGGAVVLELAAQPLESLPVVWGLLRQGRPVSVHAQRGALRITTELLSKMSTLIGPGLSVCEPGEAPPAFAQDWPEVGVRPASARVALVQEDADPEAAAYLLARACLRRTGFDPRSVHRCVVVGRRPRLERHLRRLWLGARMGPPEDPEAFAGPVTDAQGAAYADALGRWLHTPGVEQLCGGAELLRADAGEGCRFLAPALLRLESADAVEGAPPAVGPLLILEQVSADQADSRLRAIADREAGALWLRFGTGARSVQLGPEDRQIGGALLVEQLPPGLPAPRP